jgi:hypothetical protein
MRAAGSGGARVAGLGMAKVSHHCLVLACQKLNLASLWVLTARDKEGQVTDLSLLLSVHRSKISKNL